jgi:hypothetical protein
VDHQVFQAHQAFQASPVKMDYRVFQVLKENVLSVKRVRIKKIFSFDYDNFSYLM